MEPYMFQVRERLKSVADKFGTGSPNPLYPEFARELKSVLVDHERLSGQAVSLIQSAQIISGAAGGVAGDDVVQALAEVAKNFSTTLAKAAVAERATAEMQRLSSELAKAKARNLSIAPALVSMWAACLDLIQMVPENELTAPRLTHHANTLNDLGARLEAALGNTKAPGVEPGAGVAASAAGDEPRKA